MDHLLIDFSHDDREWRVGVPYGHVRHGGGVYCQDRTPADSLRQLRHKAIDWPGPVQVQAIRHAGHAGYMSDADSGIL